MTVEEHNKQEERSSLKTNLICHLQIQLNRELKARVMSPCAIGIAVLLAPPLLAAQLTIDRTLINPGNFTAAEESVIDASISMWESLLSVPEDRTVSLTFENTSLVGALGDASGYTMDVLGNPMGADIRINSDISFFVDPTPFDNSEFTLSGHDGPFHFDANNGGAADGSWDLLSLVSHEMGHALGWAANFDRFDSRLIGLDYNGENFNVTLADGGHPQDDFDLMGVPGFQISERTLISDLDRQVVNDAFDYDNTTIHRFTGSPIPLTDATSTTPSTTNVFIDVTAHATIQDLDVALFAEHTFDSDLDSDANAQLETAEQALYNLAQKGSVEGGFQAFRVAVTEAVQMADTALKRDSHIAGVATGLTDLDNLLGGLHPSDLVILAGRPSMGKTALATNIAFHAAGHFKNLHDEDGNPEDSEGAIVGFFSLEMSAEQLATRVLAEQAEIPSDRIRRGAIKQDDFYRVADAARRLEELPLYIDDTPALSISALRTRARRLQRTHGLGLVVVDYLQLLRPTNTRADNRVQEISEITQALKALAKELNIPVLALSQLSRAVEQREDKRPMLSDLRESGSIEQDADVVMFIFREEYYHERQQPEPDTEQHQKWLEKAERIHGLAEVIIGKQRHGPTGTAKLNFQREYTKFGNRERAGYGADDFA